MTDKELIGLVSIASLLAGDAAYLHSVLRGRSRPHVFSWVLWCLLTAVAFFAQVSRGAGPGAWVTGFTALTCFVFSILAIFKGEKRITKSDAVAFIGGLAAIPVWKATGNPLYAVFIVMLAEMLAFYPTMRKSWNKPHEELALMYVLDTLKYAIALFAMDSYSLTTTLYPAFIVALQSGFVAELFIRRAKLGQRR